MPIKLLIVGGGRIGGALVAGLVSSRWAEPAEIGVVEPDVARRSELVARHPGLAVVDQPDVAELVAGSSFTADEGGAILAVKPEVAEPACRFIGTAGVRRVLSVVAGMPTDRLEATLPEGSVVVRAMPNTAVLVGAGISAIAAGSRARSFDLQWAEGILSAVGTVVRVPERLLHAVTGLSGSGPAYIFLVTEALIEAGVLAGLPRETSELLVLETVKGSAKLLAETGASPEELRAQVTSPGGTTAAGLRMLEAKAIRSAFLEAVAAATERSRQLAL